MVKFKYIHFRNYSLMNLNQILNSRQSGRVALAIARYIPPGIGKSLSNAIAKYLVRRPDLPLIHATRINQWVAQGQNLSYEQLNQVVLETIQNYTLSMYTLFHYWENLGPLEKMIRYDPNTENLIQRSQERKHGAMVVFIHSCNFDVSLRAASSRGLKGLVLSLPEANEAIEWQHAMRESSGVEVKPASIAVLREASNRLEAGETVVTGLDRPMPESKYKPIFFGRPTALPVHYIYLALKANVPVALSTAIRQTDGVYEVVSSDLVDLREYQDRRKEVLMNAGMILEIAEEFIRRAPTQWSVLHPLWPEEAEKLPA
jgi:lauroyl/myristoyl acyltransferase